MVISIRQGVIEAVAEMRRLHDSLNTLASTIESLGSIYKASRKWYWITLASIVAAATVTSAIFSVLSFIDKS